MKPIEQTSSRLVFEKNSTLACTLLLALILPFALVPLLFLYFILPRQQVLNCDRSANQVINCRLEQKVLGITTQEKNIQNLIEAKVIAEEIDTDNGSYLNYRVRLSAENGENTFNSDRQSDKIKDIVNQINSFKLDRNQFKFKIDRAIRISPNTIVFISIWVLFWYLMLFFIVNKLISKTPTRERWIFDRALNKISIEQKILLKKTQQTQYNLVDPTIKLDSNRDSDGYTYYLAKLQVNPQQNIILYNGVSKKEAEKIAGIIKKFLGCQN